MNRLRQTRLMKEISQKEVSLTIGVAQPTVSAWESGEKTPTVENLTKLAQLYNVSLDYLAGNTDDPTPPTTKSPVYDDDALALMEHMHKRPELRTLFDTSKKASRKDIEMVDELLKRIVRNNGDDL